jgi:hypothetical protein
MGGLQKMSYNNNYSTSVPYSGSVSYNYPASENGGSGTAHYSGSIPVNVTINVNTGPFDGSVSRFKASIDTLGVSVAAMHAAQCAAIQQTAGEVSSSLINGFFGTINSELSQQLQALDSAVKAGFALIAEQGKAVIDKKNAMEGDYNRISSRYIKLFADLDSECYKRIFALDKQSFNLSEKVQKELLSESRGNTAAANLLGIEEVSSSETLVFVSSLNRKSLEVIQALHDYITQESRINSLINSFLFDNPIVNDGAINEKTAENILLCIPVTWIESDVTEGRGTDHESFIPEYIDKQGKQAITDKVNAFCGGVSQPNWKPLPEPEKESLNREFNACAEAYFSNTEERIEGKTEDKTKQRIYQTMLSLWQTAELSFLEGN